MVFFLGVFVSILDLLDMLHFSDVTKGLVCWLMTTETRNIKPLTVAFAAPGHGMFPLEVNCFDQTKLLQDFSLVVVKLQKIKHVLFVSAGKTLGFS